jgi:hypothetical protein
MNAIAKKVILGLMVMQCFAGKKNAFSQTLSTAKSDYKNSPYTGYTRAHWLSITEKIISGALSQINPVTGLPEFDVAPLDPVTNYSDGNNRKKVKKKRWNVL